MINRTKGLSFVVALIASAAALTATPVGAQKTDAEAAERMTELQERLQETRERLKLSDEQIEQLIPVLRESIYSIRAVLEKHGIDLQSLAEGNSNRRLNLRQLRALGNHLDEVREAIFEKIEQQGFLSDEQLAEFKEDSG